MKISLFLLCLYIFNVRYPIFFYQNNYCINFQVQGLPTHGALPDGYVSYSPQDFVAYLKKLSTIQQHWFELGNRATFSNLICYQEFTASLQDLAIKTQIGNLKCTKILNDATNKADIDLEENRKLLHLEAERINLSLGSCYNIELASTALECYETKVNFLFFIYECFENICQLGPTKCKPRQLSILSIQDL